MGKWILNIAAMKSMEQLLSAGEQGPLRLAALSTALLCFMAPQRVVAHAVLKEKVASTLFYQTHLGNAWENVKPPLGDYKSGTG